MTPSMHQIDVEDVEYLRHGDTPLLARVFKPRGQGPFPLVIQLHGGAWFRLGSNLPGASVNDVQLSPNGDYIIAATHGRGIWRTPLP